ncbi:hypothetical protein CSHISOI_01674, partial [Colletotrichum shisoi]
MYATGNSSNHSIQDWLSSLPGADPSASPPFEFSDSTCRRSTKRRRASENCRNSARRSREAPEVLTPPASSPSRDSNDTVDIYFGPGRPQESYSDACVNNEENLLSSAMPADSESLPVTPSKRRRLRGGLIDPNATPRAILPTDSASQSGSTVSSSLQSVSRTSSPAKQMMALQLNEYPLDIASIDSLETAPQLARELVSVLAAIDGFANGHNVIPDSHRDQLSGLSIFGISDNSFFDPSGSSQTRHGPVPEHRGVEHIVRCSQLCIREQLDEDGWNVEVHHPVLCAALRRPYAPIKDGLVNFTSTKTAPLHASLLKRTRTPGRMVDYCMYIDTDIAGTTDAAVPDAVRHLRGQSGYNTVNHTSYFHLRDNPVSVSVESKRPGGSVDDAQLQMGIWHAVQWAFLDEATARIGSTLQDLPFLPGLIVQGEHWYFVATTRDGKKTTLWTKQTIGTTSNARGVYKVIRTLQYLAWWTETFYWPWFVSNVLGLRGDGSAPASE